MASATDTDVAAYMIFAKQQVPLSALVELFDNSKQGASTNRDVCAMQCCEEVHMKSAYPWQL